MAGSIRWWAKSPSGRSHSRASMPEVATPPARTRSVWAIAPVSGWRTRTSHGAPLPADDAQVAAAVDGAAPVAREPCSDEVGRPSLDRPPEVELEARRPADHARAIVDLDRAPLGSRVGASRAPWRRRGKPSRQR